MEAIYLKNPAVKTSQNLDSSIGQKIIDTGTLGERQKLHLTDESLSLVKHKQINCGEEVFTSTLQLIQRT